MDTNSGKELYRTGLHREAENDAAASQWNGLPSSEALKRLRGAQEWQNTDAAIKNAPALQKQVTELDTKINVLLVELAAVKTENSKLKAELAAQGQDSANLNALGKLLQWFLVRLGLK